MGTGGARYLAHIIIVLLTQEQIMTKREMKKQAILRHAAMLACFEGWSEATLAKAAVQAGYPAMSAKQVFNSGVVEALMSYSQSLNDALQEQAKHMHLQEMGVSKRIKTLVRARLELASPHKEAVRRGAAIMGLPWNAGHMTRSVWDIADLIWRLAGDTSTDHNYYTKRVLLAKVYSATALFWLNDDSPNHAQSWEFLERRIAAVLKFGAGLGKTTANIAKTVESIADQVTAPQRYRTKRR